MVFYKYLRNIRFSIVIPNIHKDGSLSAPSISPRKCFCEPGQHITFHWNQIWADASWWSSLVLKPSCWVCTLGAPCWVSGYSRHIYFTQKSDALEKSLDKTEAGKAILNTIQNRPLVAIAVFLFVLGAVLTAWLFWERKDNYIWLINRLFM